MIVGHENHPLALESTMLANLGPISWLCTLLRGMNGILFGLAGRLIYYAADFWYAATALPSGLWKQTCSSMHAPGALRSLQ